MEESMTEELIMTKTLEELKEEDGQVKSKAAKTSHQ